MTNTPDSTAALEVLARRRLELTAKRDDITAAIADVDAALMTLLQPGEAAQIGGENVWIVQPGNRRWNEDKARDILPDTLIEACTVTETRLDPKLAKGQLPPDLYAACCQEGHPFIKKAGR